MATSVNELALLLLLCAAMNVILHYPTISLASDHGSQTTDNHKAEYPDIHTQIQCPAPSYCKCDRKRQSVSCGNNISYIPEIPANTKNLSMDRSHLENIQRDTFVNLTNVKLDYLGLTNCHMKTLSKDAFQEVVFQKTSILSISGNVIPLVDLRLILCRLPSSNVTWLRLDKMQLGTIPADFFDCLPNTSITHLSLKDNNLTTFSGIIFPLPLKLDSLYLDHNSLEYVELTNLKPLKKLSLSFNQLLKVPKFSDARSASLCPKLEILHLGHNLRLPVFTPSHFKGLQSLIILLLKYCNIGVLSAQFLAEMPKLQQIDLQHNSIRDISQQAFNSTSLIKINLSSNKIRFGSLLHQHIFSGCPNLRILVLTNNNLHTVSNTRFKNLFRPLKKLESLYVDNTRLVKIPHRIFVSLPLLSKLIMSINLISYWNSTIFSKAKHLRALYIDRNRINLVNETSFPSEFLMGLQKLYIGMNPFSCTCQLLWFRNWLNRTNIRIINIHKNKDYRCYFPQELKRKPLLQFNPTVEECTPLNLYVVLGASLGSLAVIVIAVIIIVVKYKMHIRYIYFIIRSRMKQYTMLDDVTDYCYDAFVVYSSEDRDWVLQKLLPRIEDQEGYKLSLYDRDFIPGRDIVDNIMEHMESSRMVILVLSNNFAKSEWCKWELTMAQNKLLDERKDILVLIKLDEIKEEHLTNRLMLLMRDKVYIDWSDCDLGQDMFWQRLVSALARPSIPANVI